MLVKSRFLAMLLILLAFASACGVTPETVTERNEAIGERGDSNYQEAQQVAAVEEWKDQEGKIVNLYLINPVTGGLLIPPVQCLGVPNSSTESLEPNHGIPWNRSYWRVPIDGHDVGTDEMPGKDGTYGEPVPFRYCLSVEGHYYDFPAFGVPYIVSSASYTFPEATVNRDFETEARILVAEEVLKRGGCVNFETLVEIPCTTDPSASPTTNPAPTPFVLPTVTPTP